MELTRRKFLFLSGAAAGLSLLPSEFSELLGAVSESEHDWPGPGVETWVNSVCQLCPGGCGIRVRLLDGWPVKILGNPDHPINQGGLCPKGTAGLQVLYDPDRIRHPLKRVGPRGEGKWKEISWDEAIELVAGKLRDLRAEGRPERLVAIRGQVRGFMRTIFDRFLEAYGSPNYVSLGTGCDATEAVLWLSQGIRGTVGYDLENASYALSFGVSLFEGNSSPVWQMRACAALRQGHPGRRGKLVAIDPRFSTTAAKADEWIPLQPGTDGALALGIAHVLLRDGLHDETFVRDHTFGFDRWVDREGTPHEGFHDMVLRDYPPAEVAKISGVPEKTIERVAREFALQRPAVAIGDRGASRYANGMYTRWAIHCLNALVGSIDAPGGVVVPRDVPFTPLPAVSRDAVAELGRARPRLDGAGSSEAPLAASAGYRLPEALKSGKPYPAEVAFLYYADPLFSLPASLGMREALDHVPFIVSFSPYLEDTTAIADLILPDHTYLERWQDDSTPPNVDFTTLGIRRPVRAPLYNTRATSDVLFAIAEALGDPVRSAFPWKDTESFLMERVRGVYESGRGMLAPALDDRWYESFHRAKISNPAPASFDEFWTQLLERGAWWDPEYRFGDWERTLRTPSGKFEFYSQNLHAELSRRAVSSRAPDTGGDRADVPHFAPPTRSGEPDLYPLVLNVFRPMTLMGGRTANMPYLLEIAGRSVSVGWETWVEIHPETARHLGIEDRDHVWVESPEGRIRALARLLPATHPEIVHIPYGFGHRSGGRWAAVLGDNPNKLIRADALRPMGDPAYQITGVRLYKV